MVFLTEEQSSNENTDKITQRKDEDEEKDGEEEAVLMQDTPPCLTDNSDINKKLSKAAESEN